MHKEYEKEPRYRPFISLLKAIDDPDVDFESPDVDKILAEFREFNTGIEPAPVLPDEKVVYTTRPFFDEEPGAAAVELVETEAAFYNWGKNINYLPSHTLIVKSIDGLSKVIKWASEKGRKVRVAGFRHSWRYARH